MISSSNSPLNQQAVDSDFTIKSYRDLLVIAKQHYIFVGYGAIPWDQKFVLWRHDCDYSLNRAHALANIEALEGVRATYFLNPHCEFYNLFEKKQQRLVLDIIEMGHEIGLHFDGTFHSPSNEAELRDQIIAEAALLERLYGVKPSAFSFHNPVAAHLSCEKEMYGGLVNCYSQDFKTKVPYCSDSNGYWRFRRLSDVLAAATDPCLQVLTHPDWWQEVAMPPRKRIFRSAYGRAAAALRDYDSILELHNRLNHAGTTANLLFLKKAHPLWFDIFDYLWNADYLDILFLELWRLHEVQIYNLCKAELHKQWKVSAIEINTFFENHTLAVNASKLFKSIFAKDLHVSASVDQRVCHECLKLRNLLMKSSVSVTWQQLDDGCKFLCAAIESVGAWGKEQAINFDGIGPYRVEDSSLTDLHVKKGVGNTSNCTQNKWEQVKIELKNISLLGAP